MNYTQNAKKMQITERTLIIGVDIVSEVHYACAFDFRGIELGKIIKFNNDAAGFKDFAAWAEEIKSKNNKDKVIVGMEPTGHYWFNIAPYLKDQSMKIVLVNPFHVKRNRVRKRLKELILKGLKKALIIVLREKLIPGLIKRLEEAHGKMQPYTLSLAPCPHSEPILF